MTARKPPLGKAPLLHQAYEGTDICLYCGKPVAEWLAMEDCPARKRRETEFPVNKIAERIDRLVKNLPAGECGICKDAYTDYDGNCRGYTWDLSYFSESADWDFSLRRHGEEIWHKTVEGCIVDCLLSALEALNKGDWRRVE